MTRASARPRRERARARSPSYARASFFERRREGFGLHARSETLNGRLRSHSPTHSIAFKRAFDKKSIGRRFAESVSRRAGELVVSDRERFEVEIRCDGPRTRLARLFKGHFQIFD